MRSRLTRLIMLVLVLFAATMVAVAARTAPASARPPCNLPNPPPVCDQDPSEPPDPTVSSPDGSITAVDRVPGGLRVQGVASDPDTTGPLTIQVLLGGTPVARLQTSGQRFVGTVPVTAAGTARICVRAINVGPGTDSTLGCRDTAVTVTPMGVIDQVVTDKPGVVHVRGWALDPDTADPIGVQIWVAGRLYTVGRADQPRPDVAAAYPGYGTAHGFDLTVHVRRHVSVCVRASNVGSEGQTQIGCARDRDAFSVMTLNLRGTMSLTDESRDRHWRDRYDRVAQLIAAKRPDVITLQEVWLRHSDLFGVINHDYETVFWIIDRVNARTHADYRIAFAATDQGGGSRGATSLAAGNVTLYDADRVRNITGNVGSRAPVPDYDKNTTGLQMRSSYRCADPVPQQVDHCALIDGVGLYWALPYKVRNVSPDSPSRKWLFGPQAAVFALRANPDMHITVINTHAAVQVDSHQPGAGDPKLNDQWKTAAYTTTVALADSVERIWWSHRRLYPPLITGDLNGSGYDNEFRSHQYDVIAESDVVAILGGKTTNGKTTKFGSAQLPGFTSKAYPQPLPTNGVCGSPGAALSDHCALIVDITPGGPETYRPQ